MAQFPLFPHSVSKSAQDSYAAITSAIEKNIRSCLYTQKLKATGAVIGYRVQGTDGSALFETQKAAIEFIVKATLAPYLEEVRRDYTKLVREFNRATPGEKLKDPYAMDDKDVTDTFVNSGTASPLDDSTVNADPTLADQFKRPRKSLFELHRESMAKRGRVNRNGREARIQ